MLRYSAKKYAAKRAAAVLGDVALHELGVGLDQVERRAVGLGEARDEEDDEADELRDDVPHALLGLDDLGQRQRAGGHDHADEREALGDLVGDELRGGAHRAQERVLRARRPAAEHEPVEGDRAEGEEVQRPDADVDAVEADLGAEDVDRVAERDDRERRDRGHDRDDRREREEPADRRARAELLLEQRA